MNSFKQIFEYIRKYQNGYTTLQHDGLDTHIGIKNSGGSISAFIENDGSIGLFIPFGLDDAENFKPDLESQHITLRKIPVFGTTVAQLRLEDPVYEGVFAVFVNTYLKVVTTDPEKAVTLASIQLKKWRSLFTSVSKTGMTDSQELGLIGELQTLMDLLETEGSTAFYRWTGPSNQSHDFRFDDRGIECKATQIVTGLSISINGTNQLLPEPGRKLFLSVRKYEKTPNGLVTLSSLVNELANDPRIPADEFLKTIHECGYSLANSDQPDENKFWLRNHVVFEVCDGFPRILPNQLPPRVYLPSYTVDLHPPSEVPGYRKEGLPL